MGNKRKVVRVFGDRTWQNGVISGPEPFEQMPLVYERAYGGVHNSEDGKLASVEKRNPVGCGYLGDRQISSLEDWPLPNLEDPDDLMRSPSDVPMPACFAFVSPNWQPRVAFAGTYDENWQNQRAPFLPEDFNRRFLNAAHSDLIYDGFLQGGEPVRVTHMHPKGDLQFNLPVVNLKCRVDVANQIKEPAANIETLIIEPNDLRTSIVWKAELACDKQTSKIKEISLSLTK